MDFRKHSKKKIIEKIEEIKKEIEEIKTKISKINIESSLKRDEIQRILKHYVPSKITGFSMSHFGNWHYTAKTYVYKDGEEYIFDHLDINNPVFKQGDKDNVIYASSGDGEDNYILDLEQKSFIKI